MRLYCFGRQNRFCSNWRVHSCALQDATTVWLIRRLCKFIWRIRERTVRVGRVLIKLKGREREIKSLSPVGMTYRTVAATWNVGKRAGPPPRIRLAILSTRRNRGWDSFSLFLLGLWSLVANGSVIFLQFPRRLSEDFTWSPDEGSPGDESERLSHEPGVRQFCIWMFTCSVLGSCVTRICSTRFYAIVRIIVVILSDVRRRFVSPGKVPSRCKSICNSVQ